MIEPRRYSERLGVLTGEQLQAAADVFDLGRVTGAEPATTGLFGQVVLLTTERAEYAMRGHPHGHVQLVKERVIAERIHEDTDLRAPWPYQVCDDDAIFGWTFAVMPRLPGRSYTAEAWSDLARDERRATARGLGAGIARLHRAGRPTLATFDDETGTIVDFEGDLAGFMRMQVARWKWWMDQTAGAWSAEDEAWFEGLFADAARPFAEGAEPVLVHHDFSLGNALFAEHEVVGVVDLGEAFYGDGDQDLVRSLCSLGRGDRQALMDGYLSIVDLGEGAPERIAAYTALDRSIIWEYGKRNGVWFTEDMTYRGFAEPFVEQIRELVVARPIVRPAARLIVVDPDGALLLQRFEDADGHTWWVCPGGGLHPGEEARTGARRESVEELGVDLEPGPEVWRRRHSFPWRGRTIDQRERFFLARVPERFDPVPRIGDDSLWEEGVREQRWLTVEEIEAMTDEFAPADLAVRVRELLDGNIPDEPVEVLI